ncbi:hypothetical protein VNI00_007145 [Paramarasmius palmivorus]|uniref:Uncharacterized protein n=1 Tax=Paramarasmius palmivorus TaxID=297713 RepID=A0AAW0D4M7_9AGAR
MASIAPPKINDEALPATPAHEWANETSSKLQATSDTPLDSDQPVLASSVSTPGVEVPGSYPRGLDTNTSDSNPVGVLDMAKQYLPAQQDVQQALKSATETAKQYLPQSVAAYLPGATAHATSLPSQDGPQKPFEHSDGVGSLPGNPSEVSVAKLPDERGPKHTSPNSGDAVDLSPSSNPETSVAKLPKERTAEETTATKLTPSTNGRQPLESVSNASIEAQLGDTPVQTPGIGQSPLSKLSTTDAGDSSGGVGDLPGGKSETSIAVLPDEKNNRVNGSEIKGDNNKKPLPLTPHTDSTVAVTGHEAPSHAAPPKDGKFTENVVNGDTRDHHDVSSTLSGGSGGSDGSRSVGGTPRKAKLMDKIKGEMKVISGKLGGKEEKVEEGKRMMGKV